MSTITHIYIFNCMLIISIHISMKLNAGIYVFTLLSLVWCMDRFSLKDYKFLSFTPSWNWLHHLITILFWDSYIVFNCVQWVQISPKFTWTTPNGCPGPPDLREFALSSLNMSIHIEVGVRDKLAPKRVCRDKDVCYQKDLHSMIVLCFIPCDVTYTNFGTPWGLDLQRGIMSQCHAIWAG